MAHILRVNDNELKLIKTAVIAVAQHLENEIKKGGHNERELKKLKKEFIQYNKLREEFKS